MEDAGSDDRGLVYLGGAAIIGVPARDLSAAEADQYGRRRLIASGLYRERKIKRNYPSPRKATVKEKENNERN